MRGRLLVFAGILGMFGVAVGAMSAHGLESVLSPEALEWLEIGSRYQLIHAAALVAIAFAPSASGIVDLLISWAGTILFLGAFVFGGTLYLLALGDTRWLGAIAPIGGGLMIVGWALVLIAGVAALRNRLPG
ncbi:MAG: DUF423 domain-containing protein [Pseudomonadota bacterium]